MWLRLALGATLIGVAILPTASLAQQKTVKACQAEWRANKADFQAKGVTEKAYVAQCRTGAATAQPAPASTTANPAPPPTPPPSSTVQGKTVKACQEEWRANKADFQAKGVTEKGYVAQCRTGAATAQPAPASTTAPATANPAPPAASTAQGKTVRACQGEWRANKAAYQAANITEKAYVEKCRAGEQAALPSATPNAQPAAPAATTPAPSTPAPAPTQRSASAPTRPPVAAAPSNPTGVGQFATEAQAKSHCPGDIVVWANLKSKIYHFAGYKNYGQTEQGAYMCEREATAQGLRASRREKRPGA